MRNEVGELLSRVLLITASIIPISLFASIVALVYALWINGLTALSVAVAVVWLSLSIPVFFLGLILFYDAGRALSGKRPFVLEVISAVGETAESDVNRTGAGSIVTRFVILSNPLTPIILELMGYVLSRPTDEAALQHWANKLIRSPAKRRNTVVIRPILEFDHDFRQQVGIRT